MGGSARSEPNDTRTTILPLGGSNVGSETGGTLAIQSRVKTSRGYGGTTAATNSETGGNSSLGGGSGTQQASAHFSFCSVPRETTSPRIDESDLAAPSVSAGFVEIPQVSYRALSEAGEFEEHVSGAAKLFFSLVPADQNPKQAPLFLFFNGGPGAATMTALRAHGTAPMTINTTTGIVEENPYSWSKWGNLLYVDARQAGFSYSELGNTNGGDSGAVSPDCPDETFNRLVDAADFVRVLLDVYARYPVLEDNPLVVVGESWGGVRAQYVLNLLRNPSELLAGGDGLYIDVELAAALQQHRARVNTRRDRDGLPTLPSEEQFAWQVLIQPAIVTDIPFGYRQLSVGCIECVEAFKARAKELGIELPAPHMHQINLSVDEAAARDTRTQETLLSPHGFEQLLGVSLGIIGLFRPEARRTATRFGLSEGHPWCSTPSTEWLNLLGELAPGDCYFAQLSPCSCPDRALARDLGWHGGELFFKNLRGVHTFITRALLDGVILSDAIPLILGSYAADSGRDDARPDLVQSVVATHAPVTGVARPGHIDVTYIRSATDPSSTVRRIRFPTYENAGHEVAASSPRELSEDVLEFLCAPETP